MTDSSFNEGDFPEDGRPAKAQPVARFEPEKYWDCVEDFDLTDEQKTELLQTLWAIMSAFVELGWSVETVPSFIPTWNEISMESQGHTLQIEEKKIAPAFNKNTASADKKKEGE